MKLEEEREVSRKEWRCQVASGEESGGKTIMGGKGCSELIGNRCSEDQGGWVKAEGWDLGLVYAGQVWCMHGRGRMVEGGRGSVERRD